MVDDAQSVNRVDGVAELPLVLQDMGSAAIVGSDEIEELTYPDIPKEDVMEGLVLTALALVHLDMHQTLVDLQPHRLVLFHLHLALVSLVC